MIEYIYFEEDIEEHPRTQEFFRRFPKATKIPCKHYKEVFNPRGQSFRLQKKNPALILAKQNGKKIHPIPASYGIGGSQNFYFSHLLNCLYDCRYCFLQGMFPSAHYVLFVNFEDFKAEIKKKHDELGEEPSWFFSGYDCDSLALESLTGFAQEFIPFFRELPNSWLELRTKSIASQVLERTDPLDNAVVAFSFTPEEISQQLEHKVPSVQSRIKAMEKLAALGWKIGLRIDPIIDCVDFDARYAKLFNQLIAALPAHSLHSVSLGAFRMPTGFFRSIQKLYPKEPLFSGKLEKKDGSISYRAEIERERISTCRSLLLSHIPIEKLFLCDSVEIK